MAGHCGSPPPKTYPNVTALPPPWPSRENKVGSVCMFPDDGELSTNTVRSCAALGGGGGELCGGVEGEVQDGGCRCTVQWRREVGWEAKQ